MSYTFSSVSLLVMGHLSEWHLTFANTCWSSFSSP